MKKTMIICTLIIIMSYFLISGFAYFCSFVLGQVCIIWLIGVSFSAASVQKATDCASSGEQ